MSKFYISTAIAYPNAKPHMGHALEFIQADCISRYYQMKGEDVFFSTGTDEHGTKIEKTAKKENLSPQDLVDRNVEYFKKICSDLEISYNSFYRTSDPMLQKGAQKLWSLLESSEDIYKKEHIGLYCYGCESYKLEKDLIDGKCPNHNKAPEKVAEENYFFRLTKYKEAIKAKIISKEIKIFPEFRIQEILNVLDELEDVSFSRPKSVLSWGVTVPSDPSHVMYVWCDALANYITGLNYIENGENFKKFWPNDLNIIGKDITRFHAIYWPAMLMSAKLPLPKKIMVHGFVTSEGKKMSKSLGNVVDPCEIAEKYGSNALRYYLLREIPTLDDGDFSISRFIEVYNTELANNLGNLVNRLTTMILKYVGENMEGTLEDGLFKENLEIFSQNYHNFFTEFEIKKAIEEIIKIIDMTNKYIDDNKPWAVAKDSKEKVTQILFNLIVALHQIGILLYPVIPSKAKVILNLIGVSENKIKFDGNLSVNKKYTVKKGEVLFPRIENEKNEE